MSRDQPPMPAPESQPPVPPRFQPPSSALQDDGVMRVMLPVGRTALSIVAGYVGLLALLVVPAPLALAVGIWALLDLKKHPEKSGMGRAIFAIVMGALGSIALALLMLR